MWRILYFAQLAGPQLGEKEGGGLPCPFFENKKKCPDFRKESPIVSILILNLLFKMQF